MAVSEADQKIIDKALERFKLCEDAEDLQRRKSIEDIEFCDVDDMQWEPQIRTARRLDGRPCLTINTTQQFVKQVVNDMRQNRPSIHVAPVEDSDEETAEVLEGMARHIEVRSNASIAYDTACTFQVKGGLGYIRVVTDYEDDVSFNQEIKIMRVKNPFAVYLDPYSVEPDGSDAMFGFVIDDIPRSDYKKNYKHTDFITSGAFEMKGNNEPSWMNETSIRIAEYFTVDEEEETIYQMANGSVIDEDTYKQYKDEGGMEEPLNTRKRIKRKVMWYKMTAHEILERSEWMGKYIPIVPVIGEENEVNGKRDLVGLVRRMKDPQRMVNYWESAKTEAIALAPKAPFIAALGQLNGVEDIWKTANTKNWSVLPYNPTDINGIPVPPPQRMQAEAPVQTLVQATEQSYENMKRAAGIYSANLGDRSTEVSGKAILARQKQGDTANFHFMDNLSRAIQQVGRIVVDLIPKIYDAPRVVRILGVDGEPRTVKINQEFEENGVVKIYDLGTGKFDVVVETGPSYNTKREQAVDSMVQLVSSAPELMPVIGDLLVGAMDWPKAKEISERLKKMLPPQLQDKQEGEIPEQVQAQIQQAQQMIEALTQQLNESQDKLDSKEAELASKEKIAAENNRTDIVIEAMKAESNAGLQLMMEEIRAINANLARIQAKEDMADQVMQPQEPQPMQ